MELTIFEILLLFIFAIAISFLIGLNVLHVVDKRLNDIQINVPTCPKCPSDSKNNSEKLESFTTTFIDSFNEQIINEPLVEPANLSARSSLCNSRYPLIIDSVNNRDLLSLDDKELLLRQGYLSHIDDKIINPLTDDSISYNGTKCLVNCNNDEQTRIVSCRQVNKRKCRPYIDKIEEGNINVIRSGFMSPMSNKISDVRYGNMKFYVPKVYMGDNPYISGVNNNDVSLESPADIDQIGSDPLNDSDTLPVPISAFADY